MSQIHKKDIIILSYPCMIAAQLIYSIVTRGIKDSVPYLLVLMVYSTLTFLAYRGNNIATWVVIISVLLSGIGTFLIGVFLIAVNQAAMKTIFVLLGSYFIYGGIALLGRGRNVGSFSGKGFWGCFLMFIICRFPPRCPAWLPS